MPTTICLDFGNTRLKAALFIKDQLTELIHLREDVTEHLLQIIVQHQPHFSILSSVINHSSEIETLLDVGVNIENRTLRSPNRPEKFTTSNALFSYLHIGVPLRKNWGLSFGLKPLSRISYEITRNERLKDPSTGLPIDSAYTEFSGNGGSYLPSIGTGFAIKNFSVGVNVGYLFGRRESTTKRALINDSVSYNNSNLSLPGCVCLCLLYALLNLYKIFVGSDPTKAQMLSACHRLYL